MRQTLFVLFSYGAFSGALLPQPASAAPRNPSPYVRSDNVNSVVYRGADNHIHELYLPLGAPAWKVGDLSALTGAIAAAGDPSGYRRSDNVNSVVYRGADNHIHELYLPLGAPAWKVGDLSALTGAVAAAGNPVGYRRSDNVNSVVYLGSDNHIHELYLPLGAPAWKVGDLSALSGAPAAAGDPAPYVRSDNVNSVVFRGTDNDIHEIYLGFDAPAWKTGNLSTLTGAIAAAGDPFGYRRSDNVNAVVFRGIDNDIHEISLPLGAPAWKVGNLSALSGAPFAVGDPAAYRRSDNVNSVLFRAGSNGDVHEIYLPLGAPAWKTGDLSALSGAPPAAGDPTPYVRSDSVNSVVLRALDNDIHEIYLPLGAPAWKTGNLSTLTGAPPASGAQ